MDDALFDITAFRLYRTPPLVIELAGSFPDYQSAAGKRALSRKTPIYGSIETPIHVLVGDRTRLRNNVALKTHLWAGELPVPAITVTEDGLTVASPLFTLLSLAPHLSVTQLAMAMFEVTGTFAVYRPNLEISQHLQELIDHKVLPLTEGWRPSLDPNGKLTDLWQRPPLVTLDELRAFAERTDGMRGGKKFRQAARCVQGVTSSPFEAIATMLFGLPRRRGGAALGIIENNYAISLSRDAQRIASLTRCRVDLRVVSKRFGREVLIECQGNPFHSGEEQSRYDDNRRLALQTMGYTVISLRYEQLADPVNFRNITAYLAHELGVLQRPLTPRLEQAALELRRDLFIDWWTLGT